MNDNFLEKFRQKPRPEFARELYSRLQRQENDRGRIHKPAMPKRLAQGLTAALVVITMTFILLPGVLAWPSGSTAHVVSGFTILEVDRFPTQESSAASNPRIRTAPVTNLQEARRIAGFQFMVPTYIPESFVAQHAVNLVGETDNRDIDRVAIPGKEIYLTPSAVGITYRDTRSPRRIQLWAVRSGFTFDKLPLLTVGRGSYSSVSIHLRPASLVQGEWNLTYQRWDNSRGGFIAWTEDGIAYYLVVTNGRLPKTDLVEMARSMK